MLISRSASVSILKLPFTTPNDDKSHTAIVESRITLPARFINDHVLSYVVFIIAYAEGR